MATEVKLPRLGQGMEAGTIVKWLKSEGDKVEKGEPLFEIDTDKVTQEVEADFSGTLLKIALESGEAPVGETIAWIGDEGEQVAAEAPGGDSAGEADRTEGSDAGEQADGGAPQSAEKPAQAPAREPDREEGREAAAQAAESQPAAERPVRDSGLGERAGGNRDVPPAELERSKNGGRIKASPLARRIARERGIDLSRLSGTGPDGRIVAEDVERAEAAPAAAPAAAPPGEVESVPLTNIRKTIARRLTEAWQAPVFQLTVSADMERADRLVARSRELNPDVRVTVTDVLAKISAQALMRHRDVNVQFSEDALLKHPSAHIGIAVAAPQGLVVPVVRGVERLSLPETANARGEAVGRARDGKLQRDDLEGGTFTISNLGMYGVEQFVAVLNPPQAAILAVGATEDRVVARDGEIVVRPTMTMTLTVDHRAVDGAAAADFLRTLKTFLEDPALAL
ncbi:MAG TPA: dihydrolipoamide acetyltransferase family protein [Gaiellaceae bacterium]|nr:dihydrolipoamide acetyltransferase family protein [Gaiellaceae bacterium]